MRIKQWISVLLALSMTLTQLPLAAFADGEIPKSSEVGSEEVIDDNTEEIVLEQEFFTEGVPSVELPDNDELYNGYAYQQLYGEISTFSILAREHLTEKEQGIYDYLKGQIENIAALGRGSTYFLLSQKDLENMGIETTFAVSGNDWNYAGQLFNQEFDLRKIMDALLADCPYELYWFDKVSGWQSGFGMSGNGKSVSITEYFIRMMVAQNYQGGDDLSVSSGAAAITTAVETAQSIVNRYASQYDYQKLLSYKNEICSMVDYNYAAANNGNFSENNDPWQLIYVFDGDSSTKTVCEGYSKAMQYLCDLSSFNGDVYCYSVSGKMDGGAHMWNIVEIKGKNYLLDVTNSDSGTIGQNGELFLAGGIGSVHGGYRVAGTDFVYDREIINLWGEEALILSSTKYVDSGNDIINLQKAVITVNPAEIHYTGLALTPEVIVKVNGVTLTEGKDYTLTFSNNVAVGIASVLVSGKGNYTGSVSVEFKIISSSLGGNYGTSGNWTLSEDGTLTISGSGEMYGEHDDVPWFSHRKKIKKVVIEDGVTSIGGSAFYDCDSLESITIPESVTSIGGSAFEECDSLVSITIPESVTSIGNWAFYDCDSLENITIPKSVTSIGSNAFYDCPELSDVYFAGSKEQWNAMIIGYGNDELLNATIHYGVVSEIVVGNLNGDDEINSADVNLLYRVIMDYAELSDEQLSAADVNNDSDVNSADVNMLYRYVMGYLPEL